MNGALLAIVLPMRNEGRHLPAVLRALSGLLDRDPDLEVVLCDNMSTDESPLLLHEFARAHAHAHYLRVDASSAAAVRNAGARLVEADVYAFVDGDCVIEGDFAQECRRAFADAAVVAAGSWVGMPTDAPWVERTWQAMHEDEGEGDVRVLNGANLSVRGTAFRAVGGFREDLRTNEDEDLCLRLRSLGRIRCEPRMRVVHLGNPKTISAFWRRAEWHAQSIPRVIQSGGLDLGIMATLAHGAALGLALALVCRALVTASSPGLVGAAAGLMVLTPLAAVAYRTARGRGVSRVQALLLYAIFLTARVYGLARALLGGGWKSWKR